MWRDTAALYRATLHGSRIVNGYNGFEPIYYQVLRRAFANRNPAMLDALAPFGPLLIVVYSDVDASFIEGHPNFTRLNDDGSRALFWLPYPAPAASQDHCQRKSLAVNAAFDAAGEIDATMLTDQNPATRWITSHPQRVGDRLILDLGRVQQVCGLVVSMGDAAVLYPGMLSVATSVDNVSWETGFMGTMGAPSFRAALENPRDAGIIVPLSGMPARFVRLRVEQSSPQYPWAVADVMVWGQS